MGDFTLRTLKLLKGKKIPRFWIFIDTETSQIPGRSDALQYFRLGWGCLWIRRGGVGDDIEEWRFFESDEDLCRWIEYQALLRKDVVVIGHNIFFDFQACGAFEWFALWGWKVKFYYDRGLTYLLRCSKGAASFTVASSTNWFDQSLRELGGVVGLEKGEVDFRTASARELKDYCRRDVEIIVAAVRIYIDFIVSNGLGRFCLTKASQAMTAYRTRFMDHAVYLHNNEKVIDLERAAYLGGRCEAFHIGQVPGEGFISLDVNGMYPYVMKRFGYPYRLTEYSEDQPVERFTDVLRTHAVVAECEVDTSEPVYGIRITDKTVFPVGEFTCYLCSEGLRYGLERGYIKKVRRCAIYRRADLFSGYVDFFQSLREKYKAEKNPVMDLLCKYFHNSLYGKFAQRGLVTEFRDPPEGSGYFRREILDMVTGGFVTETCMMNQLIVQWQEGEGRETMVAIAAHVSENARMALWDIICKAGRDRILYCDTDSVKLRDRDAFRLRSITDPGRLGFLKIENRSRSLTIEGAKAYRTETGRAIKGIPLTAEEISPGVFKFESFRGPASHLREGISRGAKIEVVTRALERSYDKGCVLPDGRVEPFRLGGLWQQLDESEIPF